jgi:serine/threonine protein kinase
VGNRLIGRGTPLFVAPEIAGGSETPVDPKKSDMWSCGVVLYHMITCNYPFYGENEFDLYRRISTEDVDLSSVRDEAKGSASSVLSLLRRLLERNPALRLSAVEALSHPWLRGSVDRDACQCLEASQGHLRRVLDVRAISDVVRRDQYRHIQFVSDVCNVFGIEIPPSVVMTDPSSQVKALQYPGISGKMEPCVDTSLFLRGEKLSKYAVKGRADNDVRSFAGDPQKRKILSVYFNNLLSQHGYIGAQRTAPEGSAETRKDMCPQGMVAEDNESPKWWCCCVAM